MGFAGWQSLDDDDYCVTSKEKQGKRVMGWPVGYGSSTECGDEDGREVDEWSLLGVAAKINGENQKNKKMTEKKKSRRR